MFVPNSYHRSLKTANRSMTEKIKLEKGIHTSVIKVFEVRILLNYLRES